MAIPNLSLDTSIQEKDVLGGSFVKDTGLYPAKITLVYMDQSKKGAYSLNFKFELEDGSTYSDTIYITGGDEKGNLNYYIDKNGKKQYLPGFSICNQLTEVAAKKTLAECAMEDKVVQVFDYDLGKNVPVTKPVLMDLINTEVILGIVKIKEFKKKQNAAGKYVNTDEVKEKNEINKVFSKNGKTAIEEAAGDAEGTFMDAWGKKHASTFVVDKTKGKASKTSDDRPDATTSAPTKSLFS